MPATISAAASTHTLRRSAWWLTALTIGWNALEAVVATVSGVLAGSIALVGFGLDSVVDGPAGGAGGGGPGASGGPGGVGERCALRLLIDYPNSADPRT